MRLLDYINAKWGVEQGDPYAAFLSAVLTERAIYYSDIKTDKFGTTITVGTFVSYISYNWENIFNHYKTKKEQKQHEK